MMETQGTRPWRHSKKTCWGCVRADMESFGWFLDMVQKNPDFKKKPKPLFLGGFIGFWA